MMGMKTLYDRWSLSPEQWVSIGAVLYALATIVAQLSGSTPIWHEASSLKLSSDLIASLGLAFAVFQAFSKWSNRPVRRYWLMACAGMLLIWVGETVVDQFEHTDFRLVILAWAIAAALLFRCVRPYLTGGIIEKVMWIGLAAQITAHIAWILQDGLLEGPRTAHPGLQMVTDSGELIALLGYSLALALARLSHLDDHAARQDRLPCWARTTATPETARPRICFPYIAQIHQIFHSLPIAVALAQRYPDLEVHIAGSRQNLQFARRLVRDRAGPVSLHFDQLYHPWSVWLRRREGATVSKRRVLRANRLYFSGFDAIVTPERTSLYLRKICPPNLKLIGTEHGAGDREVSFTPALAHFDFLLLAGEKQAKRLLELDYTAPGRFVAGIYAKLDWIVRCNGKRPRLFDNDRPTVLYNPHFEEDLSSWPLVGPPSTRPFRPQHRLQPDLRAAHPPVRRANPGQVRGLPRISVPPAHPHRPGQRALRRHDLHPGRGHLSRRCQQPGGRVPYPTQALPVPEPAQDRLAGGPALPLLAVGGGADEPRRLGRGHRQRGPLAPGHRTAPA